MLELNTSYSLSKIPYMSYDALDSYAEELIRDAAPECLNTPKPIDADRFLEFYLELAVEYHRICYDRKVIGMTAFNDGYINIMNESTGQPYSLYVTAGTVILDTSLVVKRSEPRLRFTMMHEGSHWLVHRKAFAKDNPFGPIGAYENQYLVAKEGYIDYRRSQCERTDIERMERQADFLASALLMPRPALRTAYRDFFAVYKMKPHRIVKGVDVLDDLLAVQLSEYVAKLFNVSKRAAIIRLEKLNAIVNKRGVYHSL